MYSSPKTLLLFCLLAVVINSSAQQFGGNPPSLKWKQINTDTVRVIFPDGLQKLANEIAAISHQLGATQSTLGKKVRKINIVMQNQTTISNAYVGLGPYRSEFYMTPQQNSFELGSLPWYQQLVLHEYRHVQQYNNFRKGISGLFYILAGELGVSLEESMTGGGSDGNWTAAVGTPTLDGLGAVGGGAHADDEHVLADSMPERAALLAELVADLLGAPS